VQTKYDELAAAGLSPGQIKVPEGSPRGTHFFLAGARERPDRDSDTTGHLTGQEAA
jgi:hypothetical protein